jgi:uncharacterized protein (DUF58 family)
LFLGFSAVNTGNNLVYLVVSVLLSFMGISGFFGMRNIKQLRVELELPEEIYSGSDFLARVVIINDKRFTPSFLISVRAADSEALVPVIDRAGFSCAFMNMRFDGRGRHRVDNIQVSSVYPFSFFTRFRRLDEAFEVVVLPAPKKCALSSIFTEKDRSRGDVTADRAGYESDIRSIREYRYGDPKKYIHWKASARTQELKVKELSTFSHRPLIIDFENLSITDMEERISCVAYHIQRSFRLNIPVGLKIGGRTLSPPGAINSREPRSGRIAMLRELALYGNE